MALKKTSETIQISTLVEQGVANAFEVYPTDLQLNPLDNEVFVVQGVKIDYLGILPSAAVGVATPGQFPVTEVAITTTRPTIMPSLANSNVLAYSNRQAVCMVNADGLATYFLAEQGPIDTPDSMLDYIGIIATNDFFVAVDSVNCLGAFDVAIRIYGYRAKADAATYAALVQSEVLSS